MQTSNINNPLILIIDNSTAITGALELLFSSIGYRAKSMPDGGLEKTLEKIRREDPTIVILDLPFSDSEKITLLKKLKGSPKTRHIFVLITSTNPQIMERIENQRMEFDGFLSKPFMTSDLFEKIDGFLGNLP